MNCSTLTGITRSCENGNVGGLKYISVYDFVAANTTGASYSGTSVTIEFVKESGSYNQTLTSDLSTGSISVAQTLTVTVPRRDATKVAAIKIMGAGQRDLMVKITDANGTIEYMGISKGANLSSAAANSGSKAGDGNNYTLTFTANEPELS